MAQCEEKDMLFTLYFKKEVKQHPLHWTKKLSPTSIYKKKDKSEIEEFI